MGVVPLDRPKKGQDINRYGFYFNLEYLIRVQSSDPLHAKLNPASCLFGSQFACPQTAIVPAEPCSKKCGRDIDCSLDYSS
jgi:hypothetical protein